MKISIRQLFLSATAAVFFTLTLAAFAQDNKQPDAAPAAVAPPAVTPPTPVATPADGTVVPASPDATPADGTVAPAVEAKPEETNPEPSKLRRLDSDEDNAAPKTRKERIHERIERARERAAERRANRVGRDIVNIFGNSDLPKGEKADSVVAVFGSATAEGDVTDAVVSVFGNSRAEGSVADSVVSVFGNSHAEGPVANAVVAVLGDNEVNGTVGDSAVAVLGNSSVNSHVHGDVVAVLGDIKFGPAAVVDGQVVCVGGTVTRDPQAVLRHSVQHIGMGHVHGVEGLKAWVSECLVYGRPLAFGPHLMWAWWIALGFLTFYVLLALLFGKGVYKCVATFEQRPGYSILAALLTVLLAPIAIVLLAITGIGIAVIPFLAAALFFASLFGKVVMLAWMGRRLTKLLGVDHPALAVLVGGVILLFLYTVPVLGFILYKLLGWIGIGVVVYTLLLGMRREKPATPAATPLPPAPIVPTAPGDPAVGAIAPVAGAIMPAMVAPPMAPPIAPPVVPALTLPRAGFWIRMAALLLDLIIVAMICSFLTGIFPRGSHVRVSADLLPSLALYGAVMWKLKGSTVGGIVCGLKVVRLDDRPLDWGTAIVRALGCFLSLFVMGLGFIWVAFDDQRQSWHDKIAGTTVVRVPKGVSLV